MPTRHLALLIALAVAVAGLDVALASAPARALGTGDKLVLFGIGALATGVLLAPLGLVAVRWPQRVPGLLAGGAVALWVGMAVRFGPLLNEPLRSPTVLLSLAVALVAPLAAGWAVSPRLDRLPVHWPGLPTAFGAIALLVGVLRGPPERPPHESAHPNVVLVTLDTLRMDRLGAYGGRVATPTLDRLAAEGAAFEQAIAAAPQTGPSHLALLTGRGPLSTGVFANGTPVGDHPEALARVLGEQGFHTAAFVAAYPVHARFGFDQGFDVYDADFGPVPGLHDLAAVRLFDLVVLRNLPRERRGDAVNARVERWLRDAPEPFFLWVHYYDPHGPYTPPPPFAAEDRPPRDGEPLDLPAFWPAEQRAITDPAWIEAQYDAEVAWTDHLVGELLGMLERNLDRPSVVVATADHGESMTEHGILFDHGDDLYDPALRVPLIVRGPGVRPGVRVTAQSPSVDVVPTLLELLGLPDPHPRDGRSRVPELRGEPGEDADAFASTTAERRPDPPLEHALRRPDGKCLRRTDGPVRSFDLAADPGETTPVPDGPPCADLDARLKDAAAPLRAAGDDATNRLLEALGYVEGP